MIYFLFKQAIFFNYSRLKYIISLNGHVTKMNGLARCLYGSKIFAVDYNINTIIAISDANSTFL